jgi:hypothetical protein
MCHQFTLVAAALLIFPAITLAQSAVFQPGQNIQVREGDSWSAASIIKKEGRKYLVHYAGSDSSTDEWVGTDRMRASATSGSTTGGSTPALSLPVTPAPATIAPPAVTPAPTPRLRKSNKPREMFPLPDEVIPEIEPVRLNADVDESANEPETWGVKPDPGVIKTPRSSRLRMVSSEEKMSVKQLLPCADGGAVVGFADFSDKNRTLVRAGATATAALATLPAQSFPLAASPSGSVVICRCNAFGFGNNSRVDAFTLTADAATPLVSFTPCPDSNNGKGEDIRFAAALSEKRIITCCDKGLIDAWDIGANSAVQAWHAGLGRLDGDIAISPGGKFLAVPGKAGIWFLDTATGRSVGFIHTSAARLSNLTFSPTGKSLVANGGDGTLISFDLTSGKEIRTVATNSFGSMTCPDDGFVMLNGMTLVDTNTGGTVSSFESPGAQVAVTGPGVTVMATDSRVWTARLVTTAMRMTAEAAEDASLLLKPGMEVSLDIHLEMSDDDKPKVEAAIRQKLTDDGFTIVPSADTVVICRTELGEQHEHAYAKSQFHMPVFAGSGGQSMILTDKVTRITITQKGKTIWEKKRVSGPAGSFPLKEGQSLEDGAKETIKYDPGFLENVVIPPYIAKTDSPTDTIQQQQRHGRLR